MNVKRLLPLLGLTFLGLTLNTRAADAPKGYQDKVKVGADTRIDWTFAVANQSVAKPPANWLGDYSSTKSEYALFVPPNYNPKQSYPMVLFISPGDGAGGWKEWEPVCKKEGIIFAAPYAAGNGVQGKKRVRIVLDVLDDVRRNYNVDADRTYITGHSGGGRIACSIGFALPEYFGGVLPCCSAGDLRDEPWLRQRCIDRLSVGLLTGETDFNRAECERFRGPILAGVGVRTKVWVAPNTGHSVAASMLPEAFKWLEEGVAKRRELAKEHPASHVAGSSAPNREEGAKLLLSEAKARLKDPKTVHTGIWELMGCAQRWPDTAAGTEARKLYKEYEGKDEKPWEEEDIAEQRRFLVATVRGLADYATGPLPKEYVKERKEMAEQAVEMWKLIVKDATNRADEKVIQEANKRLTELGKVLDGKDK